MLRRKCLFDKRRRDYCNLHWEEGGDGEWDFVVFFPLVVVTPRGSLDYAENVIHSSHHSSAKSEQNETEPVS